MITETKPYVIRGAKPDGATYEREVSSLSAAQGRLDHLKRLGYEVHLFNKMTACSCPSGGTLKTVEEVLPPTYYADMPTVWRVEMLAKAWFRAMEVNAQLEARVAELEAEVKELRMERDFPE